MQATGIGRCPTVEPPRGVPTELSELESAVNYLEKTVADILERTSTVAIPTPENGKAVAANPDCARSDVAERIRRERKRIAHLTESLVRRSAEMEV